MSTTAPTRYADHRPAYRTIAWRNARRLSKLAMRPTARLRALPNYLIVGAQRAGTTSLHHYLSQSPAVVPPPLAKGIHWFDVDYHRSEQWYRAQFPLQRTLRAVGDRVGGLAVTGEASPYYLFHPAVPSRIAQHLPTVRILVVLRDPVGRAWSHYHHELARGFETLAFAEAIKAESSRLAGEAERLLRDEAARSMSHQHHSYISRGLYAEQLERLFDAVDRTRVMIIDSGDLRRDPDGVCAHIAEFLGIPRWRLDERTAHNARRYDSIPGELAASLRERFEEPDAQLAELLGKRFSWMES